MVMALVNGNCPFFSKIFRLPELLPVESALQLIVISLMTESTMLNSRTRKVGERMAHFKAAPREAASSVFKVVDGSKPNVA